MLRPTMGRSSGSSLEYFFELGFGSYDLLRAKTGVRDRNLFDSSLIGRAELLFPVPQKWRASTRISAFFDIGNVFSQGAGVSFVGRDGVTPVDYKFDYNELKQSTGIAVQWLAPLGVFRFSYAIPLNEYRGDQTRYPDEVENFQFTIGSAF